MVDSYFKYVVVSVLVCAKCNIIFLNVRVCICGVIELWVGFSEGRLV